MVFSDKIFLVCHVHDPTCKVEGCKVIKFSHELDNYICSTQSPCPAKKIFVNLCQKYFEIFNDSFSIAKIRKVFCCDKKG